MSAPSRVVSGVTAAAVLLLGVCAVAGADDPIAAPDAGPAGAEPDAGAAVGRPYDDVFEEPAPPAPQPRSALPEQEPPRSGLSAKAGRHELDIVLLAGLDVVYTPFGEDAPPLGSLDFHVTSETLQLGYFHVKSIVLGTPLTGLIQVLGGRGEEGMTQACYLCAALGFRAKRYRDGWITAGFHYDNFYVASEYQIHVASVGGEVGWMRRRGPWFVHAIAALSIMIDDVVLGPRERLDVGAFWRGLGPVAIYGRFTLAYGQMSFDDGGEYDFGGPMVQLGMAYVWQ